MAHSTRLTARRPLSCGLESYTRYWKIVRVFRPKFLARLPVLFTLAGGLAALLCPIRAACTAREALKASHAREVAEAMARTEYRQIGARSEHEALGIFVHDVHTATGAVSYMRSFARVIRSRLPSISEATERRCPPPRHLAAK